MSELYDFFRQRLISKSRETGDNCIANTRLGHNGAGCRVVSFDVKYNPMPIVGKRKLNPDGSGIPTTFQKLGPITVMSIWGKDLKNELWIEIAGEDHAFEADDTTVLNKAMEENPWLCLFLGVLNVDDIEDRNKMCGLDQYLPAADTDDSLKKAAMAKLDEALAPEKPICEATRRLLCRPGTRIQKIRTRAGISAIAGCAVSAAFVSSCNHSTGWNYCIGYGGIHKRIEADKIATFNGTVILHGEQSNTVYVFQKQ